MAQRFGTGRVGACFAPIVLIYFVCNLIIAITNISRYKPDIFKVSCHGPLTDEHCLAVQTRAVRDAIVNAWHVCWPLLGHISCLM